MKYHENKYDKYMHSDILTYSDVFYLKHLK